MIVVTISINTREKKKHLTSIRFPILLFINEVNLALT